MKNKQCDDSNCTYQHLVFNRGSSSNENARKSYKGKEETEESSEPPTKNTLPKFSMTSAMGYTPYPPTINNKPPQRKRAGNSEDESFLLKLMEIMKAGFQEQINELRDEIVNERRKESQKNHAPQQLEMQHPVTRAAPGLHPYHYLMTPQWFNQNFPPLSS
jgi:hypothetical protein